LTDEKTNSEELIPDPPEEERLIPGVLDTTNPQSVINKVPSVLQERISRIPHELFIRSEESLKRTCYPQYCETNGQKNEPRGKGEKKRYDTFIEDNRLRFSFWREYARVAGNVHPMNMKNVLHGVMPEIRFWEEVTRDVTRLAWILREPLDFQVAVEEAHMQTIDEQRRIALMPITRKVCRCLYKCICWRDVPPIDRKEDKVECACEKSCICPEVYDSKLAAIKIQMIKQLEDRAKGAVASIQKNLNLNVKKDLDKKREPVTPEEIQAEIDELHRQLQESEEVPKALPAKSDIIDVIPHDLQRQKKRPQHSYKAKGKRSS